MDPMNDGIQPKGDKAPSDAAASAGGELNKESIRNRVTEPTPPAQPASDAPTTALAKADTWAASLPTLQRIRIETALDLPMANVVDLAKQDWRGAETSVEGVVQFLQTEREKGTDIGAIIKLTGDSEKGIQVGHVVEMLRAKDVAGVITADLQRLAVDDGEHSETTLQRTLEAPATVSAELQKRFMEHFDLIGEEFDKKEAKAADGAEDESAKGGIIGYGTTADSDAYPEAVAQLREVLKQELENGMPIALKKKLFAVSPNQLLEVRLAPAMELVLQFAERHDMHSLSEVLESKAFLNKLR